MPSLPSEFLAVILPYAGLFCRRVFVHVQLLLAGAILVETVFNWPGLGRLAFESVLRRDYPTILGVLLFSSIVVVVMNQVTDLAYRVIDPRIKS